MLPLSEQQEADIFRRAERGDFLPPSLIEQAFPFVAVLVLWVLPVAYLAWAGYLPVQRLKTDPRLRRRVILAAFVLAWLCSTVWRDELWSAYVWTVQTACELSFGTPSRSQPTCRW